MKNKSFTLFTSLRGRLTLIMVLAAVVPVVIVAFFSYRSSQQALEASALDQVLISTEDTAQDVRESLEQFRAEVLSLSQTPPIQGIIRARDNDGIDPLFDDSYEVWVQRLQQIMIPIAENKNFYQQLRYLDETGQELVRVDYSGSRSIAISGDNLQSKADSDYFIETIKLRLGDVYISELNLNKEQGAVTNPPTPVLRFATPVFDETGKVRGIVVLNTYADLSVLNRVKDETGSQNYMFNAEGYYLHHPDGIEKEYGFDQGTEFNVNQDFPWEVERIAGEEYFVGVDSTDNLVAALERVRFDPLQQERYWILMKILPGDEVFAEVNALARTYVIATAIILVIAVGVAIWLAGTIARPVVALARTSELIAEGNWDAPLPEAGRDEIGQLTQSFGRMTNRLQDSIQGLQDSSTELRTRSDELAANQRAVRVVFAASEQSADPGILLRLTVNLIRDHFDLYHVQVYLLDDDDQNAVLRESTGYAGLQLMQRKHSIPLERASLVTKAIKDNASVLVADVTEDPSFLANPLLPDTRSELVVPLRIGEGARGALDVQSREVGTFTPDTVSLFETMTDQIALLFQNSELFARTVTQTEELSRFTNQLRTAAEVSERLSTILDPDMLLNEVVQLMQSRFGFYHAHIYLVDMLGDNLEVAAGSGEVGRVLKDRGHSIPLSREHSLVARAARSRRSVLVNDTALDSDFLPNPLLPNTRAEVAVPLVTGDRLMGVLDIQDDQPQRFKPSDINTFNTLAGQIATALNNASLFEEAQQRQKELDKRAAELQTVAEVSTAAATTLNPNVLLQQVVELTKNNFALYHAHIYLIDESGETLKLAAGAGEAGAQMVAQGWSIPANSETSLVARAFNTKKGVIANDVQAAPDFLPNPLLPDTASEMAIPMLAGEDVLGVLDVQADIVDRFTPQDVAIKTTLAEQIAAALQNARLYDETRRAEENIRALARQNDLVLNSAAEGIFGVDQNGVTVFVNPAAEQILGFSAEELIGGMHHNLIHHHREDGSEYPHEECKVYAAYRDGVTHTGEDEVYWRKDGTSFPVSYTSTPIKDEEGNLLGAVVTFRDISEQRQAQQEIQAALERQRLILESSPIALLISQPDGTLTYVNARFSNLFGIPQTELDAHEAGEIYVNEQDRATMLSQLEQQGYVRDFEAQVQRTDGERFWVSFSTESITFEGVPSLLSGFYDITDRRQAAAALQQNEERLTLALGAANTAIWEWQPQADTVFFSPEWFTMLGYAPDELPQTFDTWAMLLHPDDLETTTQTVVAHMEKSQGFNIEFRMINKDGDTQWINSNAKPVELDAEGKVLRYIGTHRDITADKQSAEEILRLALVAQETDNAIIITDKDKNIEWVNAGFTRLTEYTLEEVVGKKPGAFLQGPGTNQETVQRIREAIQKREGITEEIINYAKSGREYWLEINIQPIFDDQGELIRFIAIESDVTERRLTQEEIRKRALELQTVAEVSTAASGSLETETLLQNVVDLTKSRFALYHAHIYLLNEAGDALELAAGAGEAGEKMKAQGWNIPLDREQSLVVRAFRTKEGVIANDVQAAPDFLPNPLLPDTASEMAIPMIVGDRVLGVLDVQSERVDRFTEQDVAIKTTLARQVGTALDNARLFEETQHVADSLREVARLKDEFLANMSHELRTPLNSIIGYTQLLLLDLEGEIMEESFDDLKSIDTNSKHLLGLINDILDLAKIEAGRLELHHEEVEIDALLESVQSNNAGLFINKDLDFVVDVEEGLPALWADHIRITQVLNNLVSNAVKFTDEGSVTVRAYREADEMCLAVIDTGIGIAEDDLADIFEKFRQVDGSFTRRAEGTGLGLPITRYLVEMHNGHIEVESEVGKGSTFTVHLPITAMEHAEEDEGAEVLA